MLEEIPGPFRVAGSSVDQMRAPRDGAAMLPGLPDARYEPIDAGGVPAEIVEAADATAARTILHLHGGGYVLGGPDTHRSFASHLSAATASRVVNVDYRLAPEHCFPAALDDAVAAYRWLLGTGVDPATVALTGDSAGGGLAIATLAALRAAGDALPAASVVISPWVDLTCSGESLTSRDAVDPMIGPSNLRTMAAAYVGTGDPAHPSVSPLFGDLAGLPPLLVLVGGREVLFDDAVRLVDAAKAAGVEADLDVWPEMFHVWPVLAAVIPEGREALAQVADFLRARLA
jgi:acetyl esterase/lipase